MGRVPSLTDNFYSRWRQQDHSSPAFQEERDAPPERLLQAVWQQQRLRRDQLKTLDEQTVRVLHPGFKNHESGPDFQGAIVQIGREPPRAGDVEVDLHPGGWHAHGHDRNPAFRNVILHVIWDGERAAGEFPVLALRQLLDAPITELNSCLERESLRFLPENLQGQCSAPLRDLSPERLTDLLHQAAHVRCRAKAAQFQARARHVGWEQALWEGLFRALGYKHNTWPMQDLGELRPRWLSSKAQPLALQTRLLGIGGLLPVELPRAGAGAKSYLRGIWDQWWRERDEFADCILPPGLWRFNGLRPANHPQRRLALAAHWLAAGKLVAKLERWFTTTLPDDALPDSLVEVLQVERDDFWSWHWTFRSARLKQPQPLLGAARATDLAMNVILPWFWIRAVEGKNDALREAAERRYFNWPAAGDNAVLRLARERLLGGAKANALNGAAAQQGLLQIVRDFCEHSNALCKNCQFPELARNWNGKTD